MSEMHLRVYADRSELIYPNRDREIFLEGVSSEEAKCRYRKIETELENGFFTNLIESCQTERSVESRLNNLGQEDISLINGLVNSFTSEFGRALIGITILQLCIKSIQPEQSIRLHKSSSAHHNFSWKEGVPMRSLDKKFITPALRDYSLLRLNKDGFMMTRSLAENYPYSVVYKAQMRGSKNKWVQLVERVENGFTEPSIALRYLITLLLNKADHFVSLACQMLHKLEIFIQSAGKEDIYAIINQHIHTSNYAARLMEIAMHGFVQALCEEGVLFGGEVARLSQMRSANKKHGNIGDIEILYAGEIVESWDAKFGRTYLRDEIEELAEKLSDHPNVVTAGFVTSESPERLEELKNRIIEIEDLTGVSISILKFDEWIQRYLHVAKDSLQICELDIYKRWIKAYAECLAQKRRIAAPIDEPCHHWVEELSNLLER